MATKEEIQKIYDEFKTTPDNILRDIINLYKDAVLERHQILEQIDELKNLTDRTDEEEEKLKDLHEQLNIATLDIDQVRKPEKEVAERILKERRTPSVVTSSALASAVASAVASIASKKASQQREIYQNYSAKSNEVLHNVLKTINRRKTTMKNLQTTATEAKQKYKIERGGVDPPLNDMRIKYNQIMAEIKNLQKTYDADTLKEQVINDILRSRPVLVPPEQNPEIPTSSVQVEDIEDVKTVIGTSGLTKEKLERLSEEQLVKGKERVEDLQEEIAPEVARYDILDKVPEVLKTTEIKKEIETLKPKTLDMDKLEAMYSSYKSELERRGIKEESTQTDHEKVLVEEAKTLMLRYPHLKKTIEKILVSDVLHGNNHSLKGLSRDIGQPISFTQPIAGTTTKPKSYMVTKPKTLLEYENIVPDTYASFIKF